MPTYWPLIGLRISTADLLLRPMVEADLAGIADRLPDDVELDPSLPAYDGIDGRAARAVALHQFYWRSLGTWSVDKWRLILVAEHGGEVVGTQDLKGADFPRCRTVETASYLLTGRGRGWGQQMRLAVLALAFEELGALAAETEAWHDNAASLGVSRAVGYQPNGVTLVGRGDTADEMVRLRLTREQWQQSGRSGEVSIDGFAAARPLFGTPARG